jgi:hypothetical protein
LVSPAASAIGRKIKKPNAVDAISEALKTDKTTVEQLKNRLSNAGESATIADIVGEEVKSLGKSLTEQKGTSKQLATAVFDTRQAKQADRIYETGKKLTGGVGKSALENFDTITERQRTAAQPLYDKAYEKNIPIDKIRHLLDRPLMKKAMNKASDILENETGTKVDVNQFFDKNTVAVNTKVLDYIKRGFDDVITKGKTPLGGQTNETRIANNLKNQLLDIVDIENPDFGKARSIWADDQATKQALELGQSFLKGDKDLTSAIVTKYTPSEKEMFVEGVLSKFKEMLGTSREGINKASQILTPNKLQALKPAFPDEQTFKEFEKTLRFEDKIARTRFSILGKHQSPESLSETAKLSGDQLGFFANLATGNVKWAAGHGLREALKNTFNKVADIPEKERNELGRLLFSPNKREVNKALDTLSKNMPKNLDRNKQLELIRKMFSLSIVGQSGSELMEE